MHKIPSKQNFIIIILNFIYKAQKNFNIIN